MEYGENFQHLHDTCYQCNGYYGPSFRQPVCATCHAFLYPDDVSQQPSVGPYQEKTDDGDSGNEEPREPSDYYQMQQQQEQESLQQPPQQPPLAQAQHLLPQIQQEGLQGASYAGAGEDEGDLWEVAGAGAEPCGGDQVLRSAGGPGLCIGIGFGGGRMGAAGGSTAGAGSVMGGLAGRNVVGAGNVGVPGNIPVPVTVGGSGSSLVGGRNVVGGTLQDRINQLTCPRPPDNLDPTLIHRIPPEVLVLVFDLLDDMTLWSVGKVCRRWQQLVERYVTEEQWQEYTHRRWPLFRPLYTKVPWQLVYTKLTESAPCQMCLHQMALLTVPSTNENSWRRNRLRNELRTLRSDPPEGIEASPLDKMSLHWQASIRGPAGSPYEGGTFYLYIQIPPSYPLCPPVVRFITMIFHPNVSRHGDIGIDSIQHNWSLALTISKVLISIQSLLTDPYTKVCMEPGMGHLYEENKLLFERVARAWTWHYAMHDAFPPEVPPSLPPSRPTSTCSSASQAEQEEGRPASCRAKGEVEAVVAVPP